MSRKSVLIIDDSRVSRMIVLHIIADAYPDWTVIEAVDGEEALTKAEGIHLDGVFIDVNMPGINGLEVAKRLRQSHPEARLTLLTANIQAAVRERAAELGVAFIAKPVTAAKILGFLQGIADR